MEAYFVYDTDPQGGHYDVWRDPAPMVEGPKGPRPTIQEVRKGDFPAETWMQISFGEIQPKLITYFDELYKPYFEEAELYWTREGGYVDGSDTV